jgi:thioredoxin reductase
MGRGPDSPFQVAIVGGGPAGLAAALVLGRMRRRVLLLDADDPAHARSEGVHGLFAHDGIAPVELRQIGREQLRPYDTVTVRMVEAEHVTSTPEGFSVSAAGATSEADVLLLCSGMRYDPPPLDGLAELWSAARGAYHCPYCDGWELRDRPVAIYGVNAAHLALMMMSLTDDVVLLTDGSNLDSDEASLLRSTGVAIRDDRVARVEAGSGTGVRVVFTDGSTQDRAGLFFMPTATLSPVALQLGCERDQSGGIVIDADGRTNVPGVFAAGDTTNDRRAVVLAAAAGSRAAYAINGGLARGALPAREHGSYRR